MSGYRTSTSSGPWGKDHNTCSIMIMIINDNIYCPKVSVLELFHFHKSYDRSLQAIMITMITTTTCKGMRPTCKSE